MLPLPFLSSTFLGLVLAQPAPEPPVLGYFRDRQFALRPLMGVKGAFVAGEAIGSDVSAFAWNGKRLVIVQKGAWREWRNSAWQDLALPALDGEPLAIQIVRDELWAVLRRDHTLVLLRCRPDSNRPKTAERELRDVAAPVLITPRGELLHDPSWAHAQLEWIGADWIHARAGASDVAIHHPSGEFWDLPQLEESP